MNAGMDPKSLEIECAYRDVLSRREYTTGFSVSSVLDALQKGDWFNAIDDIICACFARGADKKTLIRLIAQLCSRNTREFHVTSHFETMGQGTPTKMVHRVA